MVSLAFLTLPGSPVEVTSEIPPYSTNMTATMPSAASMPLMILIATLGNLSAVPVPGQPRLALVALGTFGLPQMVSSAVAIWVGMKALNPRRLKSIVMVILTYFDILGNLLWCD